MVIIVLMFVVVYIIIVKQRAAQTEVEHSEILCGWCLYRICSCIRWRTNWPGSL